MSLPCDLLPSGFLFVFRFDIEDRMEFTSRQT
jgi:hypothetical protein